MKSLVSVLVFVAFQASLLLAQTEGRIVYEEKVDIHRRLPPERAEMKDMIPQFRTSNFDLFFTEAASKYKPSAQPQEEVMTGQHGQGQFHMRMSAPRREVYKNLAEDKMVDEREFMTKMFLIKGESSPFAWKIADGQKKILDYVCMQATFQDSALNYVAWFTPQIPISNGPAEFGGLPGMILQIDINQGERTLTATQIVTETVDPELLIEPTKGKEVTQEEFQEIMHEKMKEQQMQSGGPGMMIIRQ